MKVDWPLLLVLLVLSSGKRSSAPPRNPNWQPQPNTDPDLNVPVVPLPPNPLDPKRKQ